MSIGNGTKKYYTIGLGMFAALAYLWIAPKLIEKTSATHHAYAAGPPYGHAYGYHHHTGMPPYGHAYGYHHLRP